jgi:hypothetical protein
LQYNQNNGGTWQRTNVPEDNYVNYWILAVPALARTKITPNPGCSQHIIIVPGQAVYATAGAADAVTLASEISWGTLPFAELAGLYHLTYQYNSAGGGALGGTAKCQLVDVMRIVSNSVTMTAAAPIDHGALTGLDHDDHTQYTLVDGTRAFTGTTTFNAGITEDAEAVTYVNGGTTTIDCSTGTYFSTTVATGASTFAFGNPATSGLTTSFELELTNGNSQTLTWPTGVDWAAGTAPTLTTAGIDLLSFVTRDAGSKWMGFVVGLDIK